MIRAHELVCVKFRGGRKPLWHALLSVNYNRTVGMNGYVGAGNTADNAIKDYRKQAKAHSLRMIKGVV